MHPTLWQLRQQFGPVDHDRNQGAGPERVAELRAMYEDGTLAGYCDRVWTRVLGVAA